VIAVTFVLLFLFHATTIASAAAAAKKKYSAIDLESASRIIQDFLQTNGNPIKSEFHIQG